MLKKKKAFTLLEILVVVAIIGILLGFVIPNLLNMDRRGKIAKAKSDLRMLQTAVENYYVHNRVYPTALTQLTSAVPSIIRVLPADPFSNSGYGYERGGSGNRYYVIYSAGVSGNGAAGITGGDEITESNVSCIYVSNAADDTAP